MRNGILPITLAVFALPIHAGTYKCKASDGHLIYSDRPCPTGAALVNKSLSDLELTAQRRQEANRIQQQKLIEHSFKIEQELKRWSVVEEVAGNTVYNNPLDGSVYQVEHYLRRVLKRPKSFDPVEWGRVKTKGGSEYRVRLKYRAKNLYGGYTLENTVFILDANGQVLSKAKYNGKALALH